MIRTLRPRLDDIASNIVIIGQLMAGRTRADLVRDTGLRYAVLHALMIIAEAVRHLPPALLGQYPTIPWKDIVGIGVLIKHEYHRVDPDIIWDTVNRHLPTLGPVIDAMIGAPSEKVHP